MAMSNQARCVCAYKKGAQFRLQLVYTSHVGVCTCLPGVVLCVVLVVEVRIRQISEGGELQLSLSVLLHGHQQRQPSRPHLGGGGGGEVGREI